MPQRGKNLTVVVGAICALLLVWLAGLAWIKFGPTKDHGLRENWRRSLDCTYCQLLYAGEPGLLLRLMDEDYRSRDVFIDAAGEQKWQRRSDSRLGKQVAYHDSVLLLTGDSGQLQALDPDSGEELFLFEPDYNAVPSLAAGETGPEAWAISSAGTLVFGIGRKGELLWSLDAGSSDSAGQIRVWPGNEAQPDRLLIAHGVMLSIISANGALASSPLLDADYYYINSYIGTLPNGIHLLSSSSGPLAINDEVQKQDLQELGFSVIEQQGMNTMAVSQGGQTAFRSDILIQVVDKTLETRDEINVSAMKLSDMCWLDEELLAVQQFEEPLTATLDFLYEMAGHRAWSAGSGNSYGKPPPGHEQYKLLLYRNGEVQGSLYMGGLDSGKPGGMDNLQLKPAGGCAYLFSGSGMIARVELQP